MGCSLPSMSLSYDSTLQPPPVLLHVPMPMIA